MLDPDSIRSVDPDLGGKKITRIKYNFFRNFTFRNAGCSILRAEGFFCNLDVLYGGLGIGGKL